MKSTQKIKRRYLSGLVSRTLPPNSQINPKKRLKEFIDEVRIYLAAAQLCYGGPINISTDEFVKVLVLDGCFIIELFRKKAYVGLRDADDPVFKMSCLLQFLNHDLILLENQIPWLVLDALFEKTKRDIDTKTLVELAIEFFGNIFSTKLSLSKELLQKLQTSKHILDLLRNSIVFPSTMSPEKRWRSMPSATSLDEAGIKIKRRHATESILEIKFEKGVLEIPSLLVQETTEPVFRNLISLEQCCPGYQPIVTSYAILMDNLINTNKDMDILCKNEVIHNWLNVEDATKFFNKLYDDTYIKESFYLPLIKEVSKYCKHKWPRYRTVLKHDYFNHPWALISFIVAAIVVICTFIQTLYTIIE